MSEQNESELAAAGSYACADKSSTAEPLDWEREFYTVMEHGLAGGKLEDRSGFFFDASEGNQDAVLPDGRAAVLLVAEAEAALKIVEALDHWQAHACQESIEMGMALLFLLGARLRELDL